MVRFALVVAMGALLAAGALAAPTNAPNHAARRTPKPAAPLVEPDDLPGPEWRVDQIDALADVPITPVASATNEEGFVFAVYGMPPASVRFRLELPPPGLELKTERPLTIQIDARLPQTVVPDAAMGSLLGHEKVRSDPRWVEWEFDPALSLSTTALVVYQLRSGRVLHVTLHLADGTTHETSFGLRGARARLGVVAPAYDADYERKSRALEHRREFFNRFQAARYAAEARCGYRAGDKGPPCAQVLRDCVLSYPDTAPTAAEEKTLIACVEAVRR